MRAVTPAVTTEMEHWSKTSWYEPLPVGKHKRRERENDDAGASRGGSGKVLKLMNVFPAPRKEGGGGFSGGEETRKPKRQEREDDAGALPGGSGKSLKSMNVYPAARAERGGLKSSGGEEMKRLSSASRGEPSNSRRDWPSGKAANVDHQKRSTPALAPPREGTTTKGFDQRIGKASYSLVKVKARTEAKKREMEKNERACGVRTKCQPMAIISASGPRTGGKMEMEKSEKAGRQRTELQQTEWMKARKTVMKILELYRLYCEILEKDKSEMDLRRVDQVSSEMVKKDFPFLCKKAFLGTVPGIEVGEKFSYRMELHLVGMHRPSQGGIDTMVDASGNKIAISVVDSGGYDNYMSSLETLVYCAQGSSIEDQKRKAVNQAMMRSQKVKNPVRVIRTRKVYNSTTYFYDGLYTVEDMWEDRKLDGKRLKFKLVRIPGQPSSLAKKKPLR